MSSSDGHQHGSNPGHDHDDKRAHDHKHDHDHDHDHHQGHHHGHGPGHHHSAIANLKLAFVLNLGFALIEVVGGFWSGSVAVMSNAVHDLSDAGAVAIAFLMERLGSRQSTPHYSYGWRRLSLVSALITCAVLLSASVVVVAQAIPRFVHPVAPKLEGMALFALLGVAVNGFGALRLARGGTLNEKVVSWHLLEDVLGWATILIGAGVMALTDLPIIDPLLCVLTSAFVIWGVFRNLQRTLRLFLQAAPEGFDLMGLRREIQGLSGVVGTHDAHLWSLDGEAHVLTLHVVVSGEASLDAAEKLKGEVRRLLAKRGRIHATIEIETDVGQCPALECIPEPAGSGFSSAADRRGLTQRP